MLSFTPKLDFACSYEIYNWRRGGASGGYVSSYWCDQVDNELGEKRIGMQRTGILPTDELYWLDV